MVSVKCFLATWPEVLAGQASLVVKGSGFLNGGYVSGTNRASIRAQQKRSSAGCRQPPEEGGQIMSIGKVIAMTATIAGGAAVVLAMVISAPDIGRYLKIRSM